MPERKRFFLIEALPYPVAHVDDSAVDKNALAVE